MTKTAAKKSKPVTIVATNNNQPVKPGTTETEMDLLDIVEKNFSEHKAKVSENIRQIETLYSIQQDHEHKLISGHQRRMRVDNLNFFRAGKLTLREFNNLFLFC